MLKWFVNSRQCAILDHICLVLAFPRMRKCICVTLVYSEHVDYIQALKSSRLEVGYCSVERNHSVICNLSFKHSTCELRTEIIFDRFLDERLILHVYFLKTK